MAFILLFSGQNCLLGEDGQGGRFVVSADKTVLDTKTGLMWAAEDNGADINWEAAMAYCESFNRGGHSDWRLPTLQELETIYDSNSTKRYKSVAAITLTGSCPWTSDERRKRARTLFLVNGEVNTFPKKSSRGFRALPVRDAR